MRHYGFWFAVIVFAGLSVPFTAGFIGEFILIKEMFSFHMIIGIVAATTLVLGAVYMLRGYQVSMFGAPKLTEFQDLKWNETFVFVALTILILVIGLSSNCIIDFLEPSLSNYQVTLK